MGCLGGSLRLHGTEFFTHQLQFPLTNIHRHLCPLFAIFFVSTMSLSSGIHLVLFSCFSLSRTHVRSVGLVTGGFSANQELIPQRDVGLSRSEQGGHPDFFLSPFFPSLPLVHSPGASIQPTSGNVSFLDLPPLGDWAMLFVS